MDDLRKMTKIVRSMNMFKKRFGTNELSDHEFESIRWIIKHQGITQKELGEHLEVDKGLVTRVIKKIVLLDLIKIKDDANDKRKKKLFPTPKAFEVRQKVFNEEIIFYNKLLQELSVKEKETYIKILDKMYKESKRLRKTNFEGLVK